MKLLALALLLGGCDAAFGLDRDTVPCPQEYRPIGTGVYRLVYEPTTWVIAQVQCRRHTAGATHLVVFDDLVEQQDVLDAVDLPAPWTVAVGYARDALSDRRTFYAVTGDVLLGDSPLWAPNEPDGPIIDPQSGAVTEESVVLSSNFLRLFDAPPNFSVHGYLCECDGKKDTGEFDLD